MWLFTALPEGLKIVGRGLLAIFPEGVWKEYGLDSFQQGLDGLFPEYSLDLKELFGQILKGDLPGCLESLIQNSVMGISGYVGSLKNILIWLLILGIASSLVSHFVEIFDRHQIADLSFFFLYLLFMTILLNCFQEAARVTEDVLENVVVFVKLMIPAYMLAVSAAAGAGTVTVTYQMMLGLIYLAENLLAGGVLPFIHIYVMLTIMNGIWVEEKLTLLAGLLEKAIQAVLKGALGVVTGISAFQSMISPVLSSVKTTALQKLVSAIPGVGNAAESVMELVLGSAVIIKNSIGIVCVVILLTICGAPLLYIYLLAWILRVAAALLGIVSDKRLTACTNRLGEGCMLLFRTAATGMVLFLISICVVAVSVGRQF